MDFATHAPTRRIALLLEDELLRRMAPGLIEHVGPHRDFGVVDPRQPLARIMEALHRMGPAGVIMGFDEEMTEPLSSLGFPVVVVMADMLMEGIGSVNVDDSSIGRLAAGYLIERGIRQFGYAGLAMPHAPGRLDGFVSFLESRGFPVAVREVATMEHGLSASQRKLLGSWLTSLDRPVGIFAAHDPLGREILETCHQLDLDVPADVAILSAGMDPLAGELVYPRISRVEIPWEQVGLEAGRLMERMLAGAVPEEPVVVTPGGIRTRGSTDFFRVSDRRIQRAIAYMRDQLHQEPGIDEVARAAGMNRRAMERLFRSQLYRSPKQVLTGMRTDRARELIEQSRLRIGEIAEACGFGASEKLAAAFRTRFGTTPREWRRKHQLPAVD